MSGAVWRGREGEYGPRTRLEARTHPGSETIDAALRGDQPVVRRQPVQQPGTEVPWEKNPPHQSGFMVRRDHGGAQLQPVLVDRSVVDYLGREYFRDGEASAAPGPLCACGCGRPLPATNRVGMKYFNSAHRRAASHQRNGR